MLTRLCDRDYNNYIKSIDIDLKDNVDLAEADEEVKKIINVQMKINKIENTKADEYKFERPLSEAIIKEYNHKEVDYVL